MDCADEKVRQNEFRLLVREIFLNLQRAQAGDTFSNREGGGIEQQRDKRLQLHHCANYGAALLLLREKYRKTIGGEEQAREEKLSVPGLRILELGCGTGVLSFALARLMPKNWQLTATDYSPQLIAHAQHQFAHDRLRFVHLNLKELTPALLAGFDVVMALEVIEHLLPSEVTLLLRTLYTGLPAGACLVLSTLDRTPFPRPFSGYAPHQVEYKYDSLVSFLHNRRNNPFGRARVMRLVSPRIAEEAVRAEQRGGYLANRVQRLAAGLASRSEAFRRIYAGMVALGFRLYAKLPAKQDFDLDGYVGSLEFMQEPSAECGQHSFSLLALLEKL